MGFGNSFVQGFDRGQDVYFKLLEDDRRDAAEKRAQAEADRQAMDFSNRMRDRANEDEAFRGLTGLRTNGVVAGNTSGMSDKSVQVLNTSGGKGLVDATARLGNEEAAMLGKSAMPGMAPKYNVSGQAPTQYNDAGQATGQGAMTGPTVQTRAANPRDNLQALYTLAAAKRAGPDVFAALDAKSRELDKEDVYGKVGKMTDDQIREMLPGLNASSMSGLPIYDAGDVLDAKGKPTGYRELKLVKNGKSEFIQVSPAQLRQIATAHALMDGGFAQDGLTMLSGVSKDMGELVSKFNASLKGTVDTGNNTKHQSVTDENGRITANAAATNAKTNADYKNAQIGVIDDQKARRTEAAGIQEELSNLDPSDPKYAEKRRALITRFNVLNVKDGQPLSLNDGSSRGSGGSVLKRAVIQQKNDDGTYTYVDKENGQPLYNGYNGEKMPLGMEIGEYKTLKQEAAKAGVQMVLQENDAGELRYVYVGPSGERMLSVKEAGMSKPQKKPAEPSTAKPAAMAGPKLQGTPIRGRGGVIIGYDGAEPTGPRTLEEVNGMRARNKMPPLTPAEIAQGKQAGYIQ
jgi:hypothetical protein